MGGQLTVQDSLAQADISKLLRIGSSSVLLRRFLSKWRDLSRVRPETQEMDANRPVGYDGIGMTLAAQRQRHGLDRDEVARRLRIRPNYLEAIERGRFDQLPGRTYALGFLKTYAEFLGLDPEAVVEAYRQEGAETGPPSPYQFRMPRAEYRTPRTILVLVMLLVGAVLYVGWYWAQRNLLGDTESVTALPQRLAELAPAPTPQPPATPAPPPAAPSSSASTSASSTPPVMPAPAATVAPATPSATPTSPPSLARPAPTATPDPAQQITATTTEAAPPSVSDAGAATAQDAGDARIILKAKADSWIQVHTPSDELIYSRILRPGDSYRVPNRPDLKLTTGNAGALDIQVDGQSVASLGAAGQVRRGILLDPDRLKAGTAVPSPPPPPPPPRSGSAAPTPSAAASAPATPTPTPTPSGSPAPAN